jgi:hypothetical protein
MNLCKHWAVNRFLGTFRVILTILIVSVIALSILCMTPSNVSAGDDHNKPLRVVMIVRSQ